MKEVLILLIMFLLISYPAYSLSFQDVTNFFTSIYNSIASFFGKANSVILPESTPTNTVSGGGGGSLPTCSDGTSFSSCSSNKPKYCDNGNLIDKCIQCGCSSELCNTTTGSCYTPTEINREHILNYLNYSLQHPSDTGNFIFTLDSYELLNEPIPNKAQVIEYLNSKQNLTEGTWNTGKWHYVPTTASVLMFYNRSGVKPPISLDPFFETVNTWEEVDAHVKFYDSDKLPGGWNNYWGGLWGYVTSYVVYKHEAPPWKSEYLNAVNTNFTNWAYDNHQRTHVIGNLLQLNLPIPRIDEIVNIALQQQKADGSWGYHSAETVFMAQVLRIIRDQSSINQSLIDSAIARGVEYVKKCYRTVDVDGKTYGLFVKNSTVICSSSCLTSSFSWYTAQGIWALLNPESDIWFKWFVNYTNNRYVVIEDLSGDTLNVEVVNDSVWSELVQMYQSGNRRWVGGIVEKYDNKWGFRFKPETIIASDVTAEGLQASIKYISENLDYWLNGYAYVSSKVIEIHSPGNISKSRVNKSEIINSLEYLRAKGLGVHDMAEYVISKSYMGSQIPSNIKQQIINYFDNNQNQTDGSWRGVNTPMFTTHRILLAYYLLNATPKKSLDMFFSNYDTWEEALAYDKSIHGKFDGRDIYHIVLGWFLYYHTYPTWMNDFFANVEKDLTWTTNTDLHKRTHILYSYVIARRQFPNLDGIIDETLREQSSDGHWGYQCLSSSRPIYCNAIQLVLLQQIIKLYPNHRTAEIQNSINRSRQWVYDTYNMTTINDVVMGYFGPAINIEDSLMTGIMAAGVNGLMDVNVDMTFEDLIKNLKTKSHSYIMDIPVYPVDTVPKPLQGHSEVVFGWFPWTHGITYDQDGELLRYHISITSNWATYNFVIKGKTYTYNFDLKKAVYKDGVLTFTASDRNMTIDYRIPHNITAISSNGSYITFTSTYRGAPLWYSKSLDPADMLIVPESNGRFGGYDGPIKIEGKFFNGSRILNFNGYGDWEHVWFIGGGWSAPKRLWLIFNDNNYYAALAELKYPNGTVAWHVGRFGEVGGSSYVFDDFQWIDDGKALPLSVELKGSVKDVQGNIKGYVNLKTDSQKAVSASSYWMIYENISGSVLGNTFNGGTAWAEIRK